MEAGDIVIAVLTLALVAATFALAKSTASYAEQSRLMVEEMRSSRELSALPRIAFDLKSVGKLTVAPTVTNIGGGPALRADFLVIYVPSTNGKKVERGWRTELVAPGEEHSLLPPLDSEGRARSFKSFAGAYTRVELRGSIVDMYGQRVDIDETIDDLAERQRLLEGAWRIHQEEELAKLRREVVKPLQKIADALRFRPRGSE